MSESIIIDTLTFVKRLVAAGMPTEQAEALVEAINENAKGQIATRQDIHEIKQELTHLKQDIKRDIEASENRVIIRLGALIVVAITILAALLKLPGT